MRRLDGSSMTGFDEDSNVGNALSEIVPFFTKAIGAKGLDQDVLLVWRAIQDGTGPQPAGSRDSTKCIHFQKLNR